MPWLRRAYLPAAIALLTLLAAACVASSASTPGATSIAARATEAAATSTTTAVVTPANIATATFTPTPAPPTPEPAAISFSPAQISQGGVTVVHLNAAATRAGATFNGRQYPMLQSGDYWWAVLATGAFTDPDVYSVVVTYMPTDGSGETTLRTTVSVVDVSYPTEDITLDDTTAALLAPEIVAAETNFRVSVYSGFTPEQLWSGAWVAPSTAPNSSYYGEARSYNGGPVSSYHTGTDFAGDTGSPVIAAAAGRVVFTGQLQVRGGSVIIDHGLGVFTAYHHFSRIDVQQGQMVGRGQLIGAIGETGLVTGPHLHWEVIVRGVEVDGLQWLMGTEIGP